MTYSNAKRKNNNDILIGYNLWLAWIDITDKYYIAKNIDNLVETEILKDFWMRLETECVAGCCGLDAFDFTPDAIREVTTYFETAKLREALVTLRDNVECMETQILSSNRLNNLFQRDFFVLLLNHILDSIPVSNAYTEVLG